VILRDYTNKEIELIELYNSKAPRWLPDLDNAPQCMAYLSEANVLGFGGAAGGAKTDLGIGKALNQHTKTLIMRRAGTELLSIVDRIATILGTRDGYSGGNVNAWRLPKLGKQIEFGSAPNLGDESKYQGRDHDFKFYDEAARFFEQQVRFLLTWMRSVVVGQYTEALLTFNPPVDSEQRWIVPFFGAWLDKQYTGLVRTPKGNITLDKAMPGELRHFVYVSQRVGEVEVLDKTPCVLENESVVFDFDPAKYSREQIIVPKSRSFIPSRLRDNKYLGADYMATLQSLPEPLRSQMLNGDFEAGIVDSEWQVCPTAWVEAAMARWKPRDRKPPMDSMGVDVARGGADNTILGRRHDMWFDEPLAYPGKSTPDGPAVMGLVVMNLRDEAVVHLDIVGVGSSPYDFIKIAKFQISGVNGGERCVERDKSGRLSFANMKSYVWWKMREDLDPANNTGIALPPDNQLKRDLTAPRWRPVGAVIQVETRLEIIKRIGRSPDWGSAYVLANMRTPKLREFMRKGQNVAIGHDPLAIVGHTQQEHDPMDY
jgi:hypothetical protein